MTIEMHRCINNLQKRVLGMSTTNYLRLTLAVYVVLTLTCWYLSASQYLGCLWVSLVTAYAMYLYIISTTKQQESIWFNLIVYSLSATPATCHMWVIISLLTQIHNHNHLNRQESKVTKVAMRHYQHGLAVTLGSLTNVLYLLYITGCDYQLVYLIWGLTGSLVMAHLVAAHLKRCSNPVDGFYLFNQLVHFIFCCVYPYKFMHPSSQIIAVVGLVLLKLVPKYRLYCLATKYELILEDVDRYQRYFDAVNKGNQQSAHKVNQSSLFPDVRQIVKQHLNLKVEDTLRTLNQRIQDINQQITIIKTSKDILSQSYQHSKKADKDNQALKNPKREYITTILGLTGELEECEGLIQQGRGIQAQTSEQERPLAIFRIIGTAIFGGVKYIAMTLISLIKIYVMALMIVILVATIAKSVSLSIS